MSKRSAHDLAFGALKQKKQKTVLEEIYKRIQINDTRINNVVFFSADTCVADIFLCFKTKLIFII